MMEIPYTMDALCGYGDRLKKFSSREKVRNLFFWNTAEWKMDCRNQFWKSTVLAGAVENTQICNFVQAEAVVKKTVSVFAFRLIT